MPLSPTASLPLQEPHHASGRPTSRRKLLGATAAAGASAFLAINALAQNKVRLNMQLVWIASGNQIGEIAAKRMGYYDQEGIDFAIQPGGPSIDGVAIVASGRFEVGQVSSSPSNMLAVSQDLPIKVFATGLQQHPYAFLSIKETPIRTPTDMVGKKIGIQATGLVLLRARWANFNTARRTIRWRKSKYRCPISATFPR